MGESAETFAWKMLGLAVESIPAISRLISAGVAALDGSDSDDDRELGAYARARLGGKSRSELALEAMDRG